MRRFLLPKKRGKISSFKATARANNMRFESSALLAITKFSSFFMQKAEAEDCATLHSLRGYGGRRPPSPRRGAAAVRTVERGCCCSWEEAFLLARPAGPHHHHATRLFHLTFSTAGYPRLTRLLLLCLHTVGEISSNK